MSHYAMARVLSDGCVGIEGGAEGSLVTGHHLAMCAGGGPRTIFQILYPGENTECRVGLGF